MRPLWSGLKMSLSRPLVSRNVIGATARHRLGFPFEPVSPVTSIIPYSSGETVNSPSNVANFKNELSLRRLNIYEPLTVLASSLALAIVGGAGVLFGK